MGVWKFRIVVTTKEVHSELSTEQRHNKGIFRDGGELIIEQSVYLGEQHSWVVGEWRIHFIQESNRDEVAFIEED